MNVVGVADKAERIEWGEAMWCEKQRGVGADIELGLRLARECQHPDARWLASLFPAGDDVTREHFCGVMRGQGEDQRALSLTEILTSVKMERLTRVANTGYAPAQVAVVLIDVQTMFKYASVAAASGDRRGMFQLARCLREALGCEKDKGRAMELLREAAELGKPGGAAAVTRVCFWRARLERFCWRGRMASQGVGGKKVCVQVTEIVPSFERGGLSRILRIVGPIVLEILDVPTRTVCGDLVSVREVGKLQRVLQLQEAMLGRARRAIDCWSMAGRR
jgi:hypothetical protein